MAEATVISPLAAQYLRLHLTPDVGPVRLRRLLDHFGSFDAVFGASQTELQRVEGIGPAIAASIFEGRDEAGVRREIERAGEVGARVICLEDPDYPACLKCIHDPPTCLYVRGTLDRTDAVAIAIVGSRRCSHYGLEQARRFGEGLGRAGFTIVSGFARGIDAAAHRGALDAGGRTLAVLGNGLAQVYPPEHAELAADVVGNGALVTELAVDEAPDARHFPPRNRIIAGLTLGTLVIEASHRSGALISARLAADYNREVFAVPGRVDQPMYCAGTHKMIREGWARLVTSVEDVIDDLAETGRAMRAAAGEGQAAGCGSGEGGGGDGDGGTAAGAAGALPAGLKLSDEEGRIFAALADDAMSLDAICERAGLEAARASSLLIGLQLKGAVRQLPGSRFARRG